MFKLKQNSQKRKSGIFPNGGHIKKNSILRFRKSYFNDHFGTQYIDFFKDLGIKIDKGEEDINKLSSKSRLSLFNYDSTGILENYTYNRPTLFIVA